MPGHIAFGFYASPQTSPKPSNSNPIRFLPHGHRHRSQNGHPHGPLGWNRGHSLKLFHEGSSFGSTWGKKFKNGFINDPVCLSPQDTMEGVKRIKATLGYSGIPITQDGKFLNSKIPNFKFQISNWRIWKSQIILPYINRYIGMENRNWWRWSFRQFTVVVLW